MEYGQGGPIARRGDPVSRHFLHLGPLCLNSLAFAKMTFPFILGKSQTLEKNVFSQVGCVGVLLHWHEGIQGTPDPCIQVTRG